MARPRSKKAAKAARTAKAKVVLAKKLKKAGDKSREKLISAVITEPAPGSRVLTQEEVQTQTSRALSPDPTIEQASIAPVTIDLRNGALLGRDMENARTQINELLDKWSPKIIPDWSLDVEWVYGKHATEPGCLMETKVDWTRCQGTLIVYLLACTNYNQSFESAVVHELLHFVVNETRMWQDIPRDRDYSLGMVHEERVVTMLTRAIMDLIGETGQ